MALLRTCRQAYAEAALMPLTLTTFTTHHFLYTAKALRKLKPHQRRLITFFQIEVHHPATINQLLRYLSPSSRLYLTKLLPCLQDLHIRLFEVLDTSTQKANEERIRKWLELGIQDKPINVKVEQTAEKWTINVNDA